jgi:protein-tyrosine phosphatase
MTLGLEDSERVNLLPKLPEALAFIERGRSHGVLVHCNSGLSRCVVLLIVFLLIFWFINSVFLDCVCWYVVVCD